MESQPTTSTKTEVPSLESTIVANPAIADVKTTERHYAGFWIRLLALIIDGIIIGIISKILHVNGYNYSFGHMSANYSMQGWSFLLNIAYFAGFWIWQSATPGKMVLGLKIVDEQNKNISVAQTFIRYFSMILSAIPFMIGFIWVAFNPKKQGWHDLLAKTYVIKTK